MDILPALDAEHVPGLGLGEELGHGALRQTQHELAEKLEQKRDLATR